MIPRGDAVISGRIQFDGGSTNPTDESRHDDGKSAQARDTGSLSTWQWNLQAIALLGGWQVTEGSIDTVVAILDTGIDPQHPAFAGRLVDGYDFVSDPGSSGDGDGRDPDPTDPVTAATGRQRTGTATAGIIGAADDGQGLAGVAPRCRLMPLRIVGVDERTARADLWDALVYAGDLDEADLSTAPWYADAFPAGLPVDRPRPGQAAHIVQISHNAAYDRTADATSIAILEGLHAALRTAGVVVVSAAGDDGLELESTESRILPAASEHTITVAPVRRATLLADDHTNRGPRIDLCAPGGSRDPADALEDPWLAPESGGVPTTVQMPRSSGWTTGSAIAAAHVTGTLALMRSVGAALGPIDLVRMLRDTAIDRGAPELHGAGLLHAQRAVLAAAGLPAPAEALQLHGVAITLPADRDGASILLANPGGSLADLQPYVADITYQGAAGWIRSAAWVDLGDAGETPLTITVDRSNLPDGFHRAVVRLGTLQGTTLEVPVRCVQQRAPRARPFAGVRVELRDAVDGTLRAQLQLGEGVTDFRFEEVPPGRYTVLAGSDLDGDQAIDDDGEFFGTVRLGDDTQVLSIETGSRVEGLSIELIRRARPTG